MSRCPYNLALCRLQADTTKVWHLKVESVEGNRANVIASDGGRVTVSLKQTAIDTQFVEFEGTVEAPNQLRETDRAHFGGNFGELCTIFFYIQSGTCGYLHALMSRVQCIKNGVLALCRRGN